MSISKYCQIRSGEGSHSNFKVVDIIMTPLLVKNCCESNMTRAVYKNIAVPDSAHKTCLP